MPVTTLHLLLILCGAGHIVLGVASLAVPRALNWKQHLKTLPLLLRQMFWTYAGYILVINISFGVVTLLGADELLNGSFLAKSITLFIAAYWLARVVIQYTYFDRTDAPKGLIYTLGETALVMLFAAFTIVYTLAFLHNSVWL